MNDCLPTLINKNLFGLEYWVGLCGVVGVS